MLYLTAWTAVATCIASIFIPPIVLFVPIFVIITAGQYKSLREELKRNKQYYAVDSRRICSYNSFGKISSHESERP